MAECDTTAEISVIVPVGDRQADAVALYSEYKAGLDATGRSYEIIFVLDGARPAFANELKELLSRGEPVTVLGLARQFGEATALMAGLDHASGEVIVTLPAYHQIDPAEIVRLVDATDAADVAIAWRSPRSGGLFERLRRRLFHSMVGLATHVHFHDLGCGARALRRRVLEEIPLYGDQYRFLPLLADRQGFKAVEIPVRQSPKDRREGIYSIRVYLRSFLDVLSIFFLARFTKKPLRFFGMIGVVTFLAGAFVATWLVVERLFFAQSLGERPALLVASLAMVLGLQLFALGLLGELIIFTHAKQLRDYQIESVLRFTQRSALAP